MHVYRDIDKLPVFKNAILTIGTFDGVHVGHCQILHQLVTEANAVHGTPVVITFYPHPKQIVRGTDQPVYILNTSEEKFRLLHAKGIEHIVVVPFDKRFAEQTAAMYIENFLIEKFHPHTIITGYDHHFGKNREGDYHLLEAYSKKAGFTVKEIPEHILQNVIISSTKIRESLLKGDIAMANKFLGYAYFFSGFVMHGNKLGRTIGYPTANINISEKDKLIPAFGVYAVSIKIPGKEDLYKGMMNIGVRPTVSGATRMIEVNIFEFEEDIYEANVTIHVISRLRSEIKFENLDALKLQLDQDKKEAITLLA